MTPGATLGTQPTKPGNAGAGSTNKRARIIPVTPGGPAAAGPTPASSPRTSPNGIVEQAGAGLVVDRNADHLAEAISRLLADRVLLRMMGERAYALARDHFGWPAILNRLELLYQHTLTKPSRS